MFERICISVNSECNMVCRYCYFFKQNKKIKENKALSHVEIARILQNIKSYKQAQQGKNKTIKINFVGSGEPLLSWKTINEAMTEYRESGAIEGIKFYLVTNGLLFTKKIASEMHELGIKPSISLDGPKIIHDAYRLLRGGKGTYDRVVDAISIMKEEFGFAAINPTVTTDLLDHKQDFLDFVKKENINKVIFGRLVDAPANVTDVSVTQFYEFLRDIYLLKKKMDLNSLEIGNIEAYKRSLAGDPDHVCTMFGSSCGAGRSFIIYLQRDVFPCGRNFSDDSWRLGSFSEPLSSFSKKMEELLAIQHPFNSCSGCDVKRICIDDCLIERLKPEYDCCARQQFLRFLVEQEGR